MKIKPRLVRRRNGRFYWILPDGDFVPLIAGGAPDPDEKPDPVDDADEDDDDDDDDDDEPGSDKRFTQEQVNRFLAKDRRKTKRQVEREISEKLGMPVPDAVKALEDLAEGRKPEAQAALDRRQRELDEKEREIEKLKLNLSIREKMQEAGVKPERIKRAVKLIELDDEDEPDDDDILAAIDELKADMPELFVQPKAEKDDDDDEEKPRKRRVASSDTPPRPPRRQKPPEDAYALGAERAKQFTGIPLT